LQIKIFLASNLDREQTLGITKWCVNVS